MKENDAVNIPLKKTTEFEERPNEVAILAIHGKTTFYTCENSNQIRKILSELITSPSTPSQISTSRSSELAELKTMYEDKLITAEEYRAKRRQILGL